MSLFHLVADKLLFLTLSVVDILKLFVVARGDVFTAR
jgi:hypothetical protein